MNHSACIVLLLCAALCAVSCASLEGNRLDSGEVWSLLRDLPRHDSFRYINRDSLPEEWFARARVSLEDPGVYIVLSNTKSAASKLIARFTGSRYNHVSLAFDAELAAMVSYNGGNGRNHPGMNPETLADLLKAPEASFAVYRLPVSPAEKALMLGRIAAINAQGSSYNLLGLITKQSAKPNIMFCSQFVYALLDETGTAPFEKKPGKVQPMDFLPPVRSPPDRSPPVRRPPALRPPGRERMALVYAAGAGAENCAITFDSRSTLTYH